jgi:hypothetical protein
VSGNFIFLSSNRADDRAVRGFAPVSICCDGLTTQKGYQRGQALRCRNRSTDRAQRVDPLTASLLERKQEEKICVHHIPEGGT